jgi:hypothetical protein
MPPPYPIRGDLTRTSVWGIADDVDQEHVALDGALSGGLTMLEHLPLGHVLNSEVAP